VWDNIFLLSFRVMEVIETGLYLQVECEKHEFVTVTQTTTSAGGNGVQTTSWVQCRLCGKFFKECNETNYPLPD
jgi:hypothetical protein